METSMFQFIQTLEQFVKRFLSALWLLIPTGLLGLLGYYLIAFIPPRFESRTVVALRSTTVAGEKTTVKTLPTLIGQPDEVVQELKRIQTHLSSNDTFLVMDKRFKLRERYKETPVEWRMPLDGESSIDDFYKYYTHLVKIELDEVGNLLIIHVQDKNSKLAHDLAAALVKHAEEFSNETSKNLSKKQLDFSQTYILTYETKRKELEEKLLAIQEKYEIFSPESELGIKESILMQLESERATKQLELTRLLSYMQTDAPQVHALYEELRFIDEQIVQQRNSLTQKVDDSAGSSELSKAKKEFERLKQDMDFWNQSIIGLRETIERARLETLQKLRYLVTISEPTLPDEARYPRRFYWLAYLGFILTLVITFIRIIIELIREHRET
jgi:capsular polysaccharide transport system permease protein